jgi:hypothetical protein
MLWWRVLQRVEFPALAFQDMIPLDERPGQLTSSQLRLCSAVVVTQSWLRSTRNSGVTFP